MGSDPSGFGDTCSKFSAHRFLMISSTTPVTMAATPRVVRTVAITIPATLTVGLVWRFSLGPSALGARVVATTGVVVELVSLRLLATVLVLAISVVVSEPVTAVFVVISASTAEILAVILLSASTAFSKLTSATSTELARTSVRVSDSLALSSIVSTTVGSMTADNSYMNVS